MRTVNKACSCVIRKHNDKLQILAFTHPTAGRQLPKGTVEDGEEFAAAALRELEEESGIDSAIILHKCGKIQRYVGAGPAEDGETECHIWHIFLISPTQELPERWEHIVSGGAEESGLTFQYFWQDLSGDLDGFHPIFKHVFAVITHNLRLIDPI